MLAVTVKVVVAVKILVVLTPCWVTGRLIIVSFPSNYTSQHPKVRSLPFPCLHLSTALPPPPPPQPILLPQLCISHLEPFPKTHTSVECIVRVGNGELNFPHFRELLQEVRELLFFPRSRSHFASYWMPENLILHINLMEHRGACAPNQSDPITLCWKSKFIEKAYTEMNTIFWSST